jgi:hypothetical protein
VLAAALVAILAWRGRDLGVDRLDELAWLCHVATAAIALGLALGADKIVAGGWLFHLVWGLPMWLLDAVLSGHSAPSSVAAHLGPMLLGGAWLWRRPWPGPIAVPTWMIGLTAMIVTRPLTVPAHNVNAAYQVWPPGDQVFSSVAMAWTVTGLLCLALLVGADRALGRWRGALP